MIDLSKFDMYGLSMLWHASQQNVKLREQIENELKRYNEQNKNYSREYIFMVSTIQNHAIGITFIPNSESHKLYGDHITVSRLVLTEVELAELVQNFRTKTDTSGIIRAEVSAKIGDDKEQKLLEAGFHTKDILETMHF